MDISGISALLHEQDEAHLPTLTDALRNAPMKSSFGSLHGYRNKLGKKFVRDIAKTSRLRRLNDPFPITRRYRAPTAHGFGSLIGSPYVGSKCRQGRPLVNEVRMGHSNSGTLHTTIWSSPQQYDLHHLMMVQITP